MEINAKELLGFASVDDLALAGKTVLLRLDINSPIDPGTKKIVSENRIVKSLPTVRKILAGGAKLVIIAHQGDTLDYQNLIPMDEHAQRLSAHLGTEIAYIDDVCGPAAVAAVKALAPGQAILLGNLRYLTEEVSTFENAVPLGPEEMGDTWLIRTLAPLCDYYVNDAFSAAHRASPSMVGFQRILPTAGGDLLIEELGALTVVSAKPVRPCVFVLGGAKISDAFGMLSPVLKNGTADKILTCGVTGEVFLMAAGISLGPTKTKWIEERSLDAFVKDAASYLAEYPGKILAPLDLAYEEGGARKEVAAGDLPVDAMFMDVGEKTVECYEKEIAQAGTIFMNGPAGAYENPLFAEGTKRIWEAVAGSVGYSVIGGGDTVSAAQKFGITDKIGYVCTAGGAMVRFLSGKELPLVTAMRGAVKP
ncbi:MAG: phosphoglycerate kinase [Clostridiales Family XIII bacterium]|jgi:phosphoglycerate kinase|nr:phosphoglycerate kinase [Clostridiales Family XIII bacterium]